MSALPARRPVPLGERIDRVLALLVEGRGRPAQSLPRRLGALFRDLARPEPSRPADEIEDLIWALWISHPDAEAADLMAQAADGIATGRLADAALLLDRLVARHPDWAEAWNKRATLAFIQRRDAEALDDIARVLAIEPRHYGAISGYGQIALRHGRLAEARAAFQLALSLNPHLQGLRDILEELAPGRAELH